MKTNIKPTKNIVSIVKSRPKRRAPVTRNELDITSNFAVKPKVNFSRKTNSFTMLFRKRSDEAKKVQNESKVYNQLDTLSRKVRELEERTQLIQRSKQGLTRDIGVSAAEMKRLFKLREREKKILEEIENREKERLANLEKENANKEILRRLEEENKKLHAQLLEEREKRKREERQIKTAIYDSEQMNSPKFAHRPSREETSRKENLFDEIDLNDVNENQASFTKDEWRVLVNNLREEWDDLKRRFMKLELKEKHEFDHRDRLLERIAEEQHRLYNEVQKLQAARKQKEKVQPVEQVPLGPEPMNQEFMPTPAEKVETKNLGLSNYELELQKEKEKLMQTQIEAEKERMRLELLRRREEEKIRSDQIEKETEKTKEIHTRRFKEQEKIQTIEKKNIVDEETKPETETKRERRLRLKEEKKAEKKEKARKKRKGLKVYQGILISIFILLLVGAIIIILLQYVGNIDVFGYFKALF